MGQRRDRHSVCALDLVLGIAAFARCDWLMDEELANQDRDRTVGTRYPIFGCRLDAERSRQGSRGRKSKRKNEDEMERLRD